jgi:GAF domain-containing protein
VNGVIDRSDRLNTRLSTLRAVSRALARPLEVLEVLRAIYPEMARALDVTICFFGLYDSRARAVDVIWQVHEGSELPGGRFPLGEGPTSQVIRHSQPRLIRHWSDGGPRVQVQYATDRAGLPESGVTVPVIFDDRVIGVLSVQSYRPEAYDEEDLALLQGIADQVAVAIAKSRRVPERRRQRSSLDVEAIFASMADALLVVDREGRLVRVNQAARNLLCLTNTSLILGQPIDQPQAGQWPLGTQRLTHQLLPIIDQLRHGLAPSEEIPISVDARPESRIGCRASVLMNDGAPAGGVIALREKTSVLSDGVFGQD